MSKYYDQFRRPKRVERRWRVHPIWRGIGCLMIIIVPIIAYLIADQLVTANLREGWVAVPFELVGPPQYPYLFARLAVTFLIGIFFFAAYTFVYVVMYRVVGPSRYGPTDSPPLRRKPRRRKERGYKRYGSRRT